VRRLFPLNKYNKFNYLKSTIKKLISDFWPSAIAIILIVLPWFFKSGYLFFTDTVWGPNIKLDWTSSWFLFNLLVKALSFIFSIAFLEKIFITGVLVLILLGGRFFVKTISENISSGLVFVLSLFALFNPFVYDRALYGQFGVLISYGCVFFILAYLYKAWQTLDFKNLYPAAIFTAIALMFSVHFIFLLLPFYILFFIVVLKRKNFWRAALFSLAIVLVLNANWILAITINASPLTGFVEQGISQQDLVAFQTAGKDGPETLSNVLLMSGFWGKDQLRYNDLTKVPGWQKSFIFLSPLIIYGFYLSFKKNKKLSLSLLAIFVVAVLLAIGIKSEATRGLSWFLYDHLPLYKGLREPQKWVAVIIPIYLYFLTLGASRFGQVKVIKNNRIVSGFILAGIIMMGAPFLFWGFNRQAVATPYPKDWSDVNNYLVNQAPQSYGCSDKVLFLPWHMYLSFNWAGKIIANPASAFFTCPVISGTNMEWGGIYDNSLSSDGTLVSAWLASQGKSNPPAVRYIILAKEVDFSSYLWLNNLSYVKPLFETNTLIVYEIKF
jgi:hypothetical protein